VGTGRDADNGNCGVVQGVSGADEADKQLEQQQQQQWSWPLLGVAFSVEDGQAFYVPLTSKTKGSSAGNSSSSSSSHSAASGCSNNTSLGSTNTHNGSISKHLLLLWDGLRTIFTHCSAVDGSSSSSMAGAMPMQQPFQRLRAVCAAAHAPTVMIRHRCCCCICPDQAATTQQPVPSVPGDWLRAGPVRVTFRPEAAAVTAGRSPAGSGLRAVWCSSRLWMCVLLCGCLDPDHSSTRDEAWAGATGCR